MSEVTAASSDVAKGIAGQRGVNSVGIFRQQRQNVGEMTLEESAGGYHRYGRYNVF